VSARDSTGRQTPQGRRASRALGALRILVASVVAVTAAALTTYAAAPASAAASCGATVNAAAPESRQINLVIDDSGSMFNDGTQPLDRWSQAKYSLEVFAAMLEHDDSLNVYRMSDFGSNPNAGPQLRMSGADPMSTRVAKVHAMQMVGGGTPYAPVQRAYADLASSKASAKWLVVLTDGKFDDRTTADVQSDLSGFAASGVSVAFLAIGSDAATIANDPAHHIYFAHATSSSDLLGLMTNFSNLIFERSLLQQSSPGHISADVPLDQALVFAQGPNVSIGSATTGSKKTSPVSSVGVAWANNQQAQDGGVLVDAVPNKGLQGTIATFTDIPQGDTVFNVKAQTINIFYKPHVKFGIELDKGGKAVDADKIVGGKYTLRYGFVNNKCKFIHSSLLGNVDYSARITNNGKVVATKFTSGDAITLARGDVVIEAGAQFLGDESSKATIQLKVLEPARPSGFTVHNTTFEVSKLARYHAPGHAIELDYAVKNGSSYTPFTKSEWATIKPSSFRVGTTSNLHFDVSLGEKIGQVYLVPRAPGGDEYAADTGPIPLTIHASHVYDEQLNQATMKMSTTITDDIPWYQRLAHWFGQDGWKWLLLLVVLIILAGYLFKRRFSKRVKKRPSVVGTPNRVGVRSEEATGRFVVATGRKLLPFVSDVATLRYVPPGVIGFTSMRLKAGPHHTMRLENWRAIAQRKNVAINGTDLDADTTKAPPLSPSSTITASTSQMTYEMTPNA